MRLFRFHCRMHDFTIASKTSAFDDLVIPIKVNASCFLIREQADEIEEIARVKARRVDGKAAGY